MGHTYLHDSDDEVSVDAEGNDEMKKGIDASNATFAMEQEARKMEKKVDMQQAVQASKQTFELEQQSNKKRKQMEAEMTQAVEASLETSRMESEARKKAEKIQNLMILDGAVGGSVKMCTTAISKASKLVDKKFFETADDKAMALKTAVNMAMTTVNKKAKNKKAKNKKSA